MATFSKIVALFIVFCNITVIVSQESAPGKAVIVTYPEDPEVSSEDEPPITDEEDGPTVPVEYIKGSADCSCGRPRIRGRIVGGVAAKINELPWTVALVQKGGGSLFCGASLICNKYVLTAAHCVIAAEFMQVYLMEEDFEMDHENNRPTIVVDVARTIMHPQWNTRTLVNDIALLELATPVNIAYGTENRMTPACVPANNNVSFAGMVATVAGWGATQTGNPVVSKLRRVDVPIFTFQECKDFPVYRRRMKESMLCAGYIQGGKDSCTGDSGGPLVVKQRGKYMLAGAVSFGIKKCARAKAPGVYTRIGYYANWIRETVGDCEFCNR